MKQSNFVTPRTSQDAHWQTWGEAADMSGWSRRSKAWQIALWLVACIVIGIGYARFV